MRNAHCEQPTGAMHTIVMEKGTTDRRRYPFVRQKSLFVLGAFGAFGWISML